MISLKQFLKEELVRSFLLGLCLTLGVVVAGLALPIGTKYFDAVLSPGAMVATFLFGGLHGLAPLITMVLAEGCILGIGIALIMFSLRKRRG